MLFALCGKDREWLRQVDQLVAVEALTVRQTRRASRTRHRVCISTSGDPPLPMASALRTGAGRPGATEHGPKARAQRRVRTGPALIQRTRRAGAAGALIP
jgi:hypothetical protein